MPSILSMLTSLNMGLLYAKVSKSMQKVLRLKKYAVEPARLPKFNTTAGGGGEPVDKEWYKTNGERDSGSLFFNQARQCQLGYLVYFKKCAPACICTALKPSSSQQASEICQSVMISSRGQLQHCEVCDGSNGHDHYAV